MCHFGFPIEGGSEDDFNKIKRKIEQNNGTVDGDSYSGNFQLRKAGFKVSGKYEITTDKLIVDISKKPGIISCEKIKELIEGALNRGI